MLEQRAYERFEFNKDFTVYGENPYTKKVIEFFARGIDISRGGILFKSIVDFKKSAKCFLRFQMSGSVLEKKGTVLRIENSNQVTKGKESVFAIQFDEPLKDDELLEIRGK